MSGSLEEIQLASCRFPCGRGNLKVSSEDDKVVDAAGLWVDVSTSAVESALCCSSIPR